MDLLVNQALHLVLDPAGSQICHSLALGFCFLFLSSGRVLGLLGDKSPIVKGRLRAAELDLKKWKVWKVGKQGVGDFSL